MNTPSQYLPDAVTEKAIESILDSQHYVVITFSPDRDLQYHFFGSSSLTSARLINVAAYFDKSTIHIPPQEPTV